MDKEKQTNPKCLHETGQFHHLCLETVINSFCNIMSINYKKTNWSKKA